MSIGNVLSRTVVLSVFLAVSSVALCQTQGGGGGSPPEKDSNPQNPANWTISEPTSSGLDVAQTYEWEIFGIPKMITYSKDWSESFWRQNGQPMIDPSDPMKSLSPPCPIMDYTTGNNTITMTSHGSVRRTLEWMGVGPAPNTVRVRVQNPIYGISAVGRGSLVAQNSLGFQFSFDPIQAEWGDLYGHRLYGVSSNAGVLRTLVVQSGIATVEIQTSCDAATETGTVTEPEYATSNGVWAGANGLEVAIDSRSCSLDIVGVPMHYRAQPRGGFTSTPIVSAAKTFSGIPDPFSGVRQYPSVVPVVASMNFGANATNSANWDYGYDSMRIFYYSSNNGEKIGGPSYDEIENYREAIQWQGSAAGNEIGNFFEYHLNLAIDEKSKFGYAPLGFSVPVMNAEYYPPYFEEWDNWENFINYKGKSANIVPRMSGEQETASFRYVWSDNIEGLSVRNLKFHKAAEDVLHLDPYYLFSEDETPYQYADDQWLINGWITGGDGIADVKADTRYDSDVIGTMVLRVLLQAFLLTRPEIAATVRLASTVDAAIDIWDPPLINENIDIIRVLPQYRTTFNEVVCHPPSKENLLSIEPIVAMTPWTVRYKVRTQVDMHVVDNWRKHGFGGRSVIKTETDSRPEESPRVFHFDLSNINL